MKKVILSLFCLTISVSASMAQDNKATQTTKNAVPQLTTNQGTVKPTVPTATPAAAVPAPDPAAGKFKFKEETHDYGEVPEGPMAETDFEFKNVGKKPIIITEAHGSCGCTVPQWPKDPILPKHKGVIHVSYNTNGRVGMISKDVIITSNAQQNPMKLHITGMVKAKPAEAKPAVAPPPAGALDKK